MHRVDTGVNLNGQQRTYSQGRRTLSHAAPSTGGWEHAVLENRCFGNFTFCRSTFDMLRVCHHTAEDVQSAQAKLDISNQSRSSSKTNSDFTALRTHKCLCPEQLARTPLVQPVQVMLDSADVHPLGPRLRSGQDWMV